LQAFISQTGSFRFETGDLFVRFLFGLCRCRFYLSNPLLALSFDPLGFNVFVFEIAGKALSLAWISAALLLVTPPLAAAVYHLSS